MKPDLIPIITNLIALASAALILWRAEPAIARMGCKTHWMIRYAMLLLAGGALGVIIIVLSGANVDFITLLILLGLALLLICDRRLRYLINRTGARHATR